MHTCIFLCFMAFVSPKAKASKILYFFLCFKYNERIIMESLSNNKKKKSLRAISCADKGNSPQ